MPTELHHDVKPHGVEHHHFGDGGEHDHVRTARVHHDPDPGDGWFGWFRWFGWDAVGWDGPAASSGTLPSTGPASSLKWLVVAGAVLMVLGALIWFGPAQESCGGPAAAERSDLGRRLTRLRPPEHRGRRGPTLARPIR